MLDNLRTTAVRLVASYQLYGEADGRVWMDFYLSAAVDKGLLNGYEITGVHPGVWGIQFITFTADAPLTLKPPFHDDQSPEQARDAGARLLNEILGDTDVQVYWISPLRPLN